MPPSQLYTTRRSGQPIVLLLGTLMLSAAFGQTPPDQILLKDYKPHSIFKIPTTRVEKARYPIIDVHSHDYAPTDADADRWVRTMDEVGLQKTIILSGYTGSRFDAALTCGWISSWRNARTCTCPSTFT